MADLPTGIVTLLFTDIEASTRLMHEVGPESYAAALAEHRGALRRAFMRHGGTEVDTQGDAFFFAFGDAPSAVTAAGEAQELLAEGPIRVRMGVHTGTPHRIETGYVGSDVHLAARICASGHGGQVVLSKQTAQLVADQLTDLGEHRLKDFSAPVWLYQLGAARFPPLRTISNTNLPRPVSSFVGRETDVTQVFSLLDDGARLVTLTGPGGSGKTRLAIEVASRLVPTFRNGVFWVGLAALRDPALVGQTIGQVLGANDGLADHIGEREMLLLLDNVEQVVEAVPELSALLETCPNLKLLVTSREVLRARGEIEHPVPPLPGPEAVELFCKRSGLPVDGTINELCRRLDNLPLAVELAAARASVLSVAQIIDRLSRRLDLLKAGRDADPRQQTLRATIEWSHDLLGEAERRLFARLALFAGGCTLEAAEEVAEADLDILQSLVDKSLLRHSDQRFWMLETIREYATERLEGSGEVDELCRRHATYFLSLAEDAESRIVGPEQAESWQRLTDEAQNLRSALGWTCGGGGGGGGGGGDPVLALQLTAILWRYWWQRGHIREGSRWYEAALAIGGNAPESLRAQALYGLSNMAAASGNLDEAIRLLEQCLPVFRREGDRRRTIYTLTDLGIVHTKAQRLGEGRRFLAESLAASRAYGEERSVAVVLINLANIDIQDDDLDAASGRLDEAAAVLRRLGDEQSVGNALENLALVELRRGNLDLAANRLRESIGLSRKTEDRHDLSHSLVVAAALCAARGQPTIAARLLGYASALRDEMAVVLDVAESELYDSTLAALTAGLEPSAFDGAWAEGQALDLAKALDEAVAAMA